MSAGSGCGSESRRETIVGFAVEGEKALEEALMGRGIGMGIGEAWVVVRRVVRVARRNIEACMVVRVMVFVVIVMRMKWSQDDFVVSLVLYDEEGYARLGCPYGGSD